jgi:beta-1,4-mannosyl-glycoprotein beta-1,4-N-acetylglucosaminyltransferase
MSHVQAPRCCEPMLCCQRSMIVDGFMFFNELELLEIRLHELCDVVDHFILVEARETFSLKPKPLHFLENRARFKPFLSRIDHQIIERFPRRESPWAAERTQRERIAQAFGTGDGDDMLVFSDIDEIPRAAALGGELAASGPVALAQQQYYLFLNCQFVEEPLRKAKVVRRKHLSGSIDELRQAHHPVVADAGWHFSFLGGATRVKTKMEAFSHQELNVPVFTSERSYARAVRAGRLHCDVTKHIRWVPLDDSFPAHVRAHREAYGSLIAPVGQIGTSRWDLAVMHVQHLVHRQRTRLVRRLGSPCRRAAPL